MTIGKGFNNKSVVNRASGTDQGSQIQSNGMVFE